MKRDLMTAVVLLNGALMEPMADARRAGRDDVAKEIRTAGEALMRAVALLRKPAPAPEVLS